MMQKQRGVALVIVLMVIALVAVIAVSMGGRLQGQVNRSIAVQQAEQAYWHWLSAEELVRQVLVTELGEDETVNLNQNWASQQGPYPVAGGLIGGQVKDLQGCFNLNALHHDTGNPGNYAEVAERYQALLAALEFDDFTSQQLVATITDWLDADTMLINQYGAEDADYESMPRPYQAANTLLSHVSELRQIRGYTQAVYERLRPFVCVIPGMTELHLNVNTIAADQPELLSAAFSGLLSVENAANLLASRPEDGFASVEDFAAEPEVQALEEVSSDHLVVTSEYFELRAAIQYGDIEFFAVSKLRVADGEASVIHRSRRGYDWND